MTARGALPVTVLLTGALVLAAPLAASAHVEVTPAQAVAGQPTDIALTVPNESDTTSTTAVRITIPQGLGEVEARSVTGWSDRVVTSGGRATAVEFRATGDGIGQGASQEFVVHVTDVPAVGRLELPLAQTSSDGTVVQWDQSTPASGEEPERPAPTLYVQDAPPAESDDGAESPSLDAGAQSSVDQSLPIGLSAAALVVALGALGVGVVALLRRR